MVTLAISDVPGDDPAVIGSGPTVPDPTTLADARAIVERFALDLPAAVARALNDPANESPKPGDRAFAASDYHLIARPADAFRAAEDAVRLYDGGVVVRDLPGTGWLRASCGWWTNEEDIERLVSGLSGGTPD